MLFAHAWQVANFAFACEFLHAVEVADLIGAPDERDGFGSQSLNLEQLQHRGPVFREQLSMLAQTAFFEELLDVQQHAFADAGNSSSFFGSLIMSAICCGRASIASAAIAVGTNAEGILAIDFEQVGGFIEDAGDGFVVHGQGQLYPAGVGCALEESGRGKAQLCRETPADETAQILTNANSGSASHVCGLWPLGALGDFKLDLIAFLQTLVTLGGDGAVVNKNIRPIFPADKSVALGVIEPLDGTFQTFHLPPSYSHPRFGGTRGVP